MGKTIVVGLGEALWDMLPEGRKLGGAPANFAYHVSRFGIDGVAVSALGRDALGDEAEEAFRSKGLAYMMERVPFDTGTVQVTVDDRGIPQYDIMQGVAWDNIPWTPGLEDLARRCSAVCFGSLAQRSAVSRASIERFLDLVPDDGSHLKIFDINLRQQFYSREVIESSLRRCNILKINDEELEIISPMLGLEGSVEERCGHLMEEYGLRMLILTCGVDGSHVFSEAGHSFEPTPKVKVVDTVGAGDSFTGAFCAALLQGSGPIEAHKLAVRVSAYVCTQPGAMPALPENL